MKPGEGISPLLVLGDICEEKPCCVLKLRGVEVARPGGIRRVWFTGPLIRPAR